MSDVSYSLLGILLMLDICFVTNFFVVRAYRRWVDMMTNQASTELDDDDELREDVAYKSNLFETILFGYVLGRVKPDPLSAQQFPHWMPIPFKFGVVTTSVLVLTALALLSPDFMYTYFGVSINGGSLTGDLCDDEDQTAGLATLLEEIENITSYEEASMQYTHMSDLYSALTNDTTLYGEEGYTCPFDADGTLDGTKEQWEDLTVDPAATYGNYFPGWCMAYLVEEIEIAESETCGPQEYCLCPTFPNSSPWTWIGWGGKEICAAKVCFTFDYIPCGEVSNDQLVNVENYRAAQLDYAADLVDEAKSDMDYPNVADSVSTGAAETFETLLYQFDVASNVYAVYSCLALFFPPPLEVFRPPRILAVKDFLFGAGKVYFCVGVVAIWWTYSYINDILYSYDVQVFFANLLAGDACYLDAEYIVARQEVLADLCESLLPMEPDFESTATTVNSMLPEIEQFGESLSDGGCNCPYPMVDLYQFNSEYYDLETYEPLGFSRTIDTICDIIDGGCTVYLPDEDITWLGNSSLCEDTDYAQELLLSAPESDISVYDMWISSGLFATLAIKFSMTNFAVGLLKLADPFIVCDGTFAWIPAKFGLGLEGSDKKTLFNNFKATKEVALYGITLRGIVVSGAIMHFCLINLMVVAYSTADSSSASSDDLVILGMCMGIAIATLLAGLLFIMYLRRLTSACYDTDAYGSDYDSEDEDDSDDDYSE